jgi:hypothetical protein
MAGMRTARQGKPVQHPPSSLRSGGCWTAGRWRRDSTTTCGRWRGWPR